MKNKIVSKMFISTMVILFFNNLTTTLGTLVDGIVISKLLGENAMAAYGLVSPILFVVAAIGIIFATGSQILISKFMGSGDVKKANKIFTLMVTLVFFISIALVGIIFALQNPIIKLLGAKGDKEFLFEPAIGYLRGLAIGIPFILFVTCLSPLLQLDRDGKRAVIAIAIMTLVNIGGDLLNVYVIKWDTFGMGLGTSISYIVAVIIIVLHFRKGKTCFKLSFKSIAWKSTKEMVKIGLPTAIKCASNTFRIAILNALLISIGTVSSVTALSIQMNLHSVFSSIALGVGSSALIVTSVFVGEKDKSAIKAVIKIGFTVGLIVSLVASTLAFIFAPKIILIYCEPSADAYSESVRCVRFYCPYVILFTLSSLFISVSQGCGKLKIAYILNALDLFIFPVLVALVLSRFMGVDGVWLCFAIGGCLTLVTLFVISSIKSKKLAIKVDNYTFLFDKITIDESEAMNISIDSMDLAVEVSKKAYEFCEKRNGDKDKCYHISLFVEEMCQFIIFSGFNDNKKHTIDLRIVHVDNSFILRLRDDCKPVNFDKKIKMEDFINSDDGLGIKIILECAKDIHYANTINTNNVFITL